MDVVIRWR